MQPSAGAERVPLGSEVLLLAPVLGPVLAKVPQEVSIAAAKKPSSPASPPPMSPPCAPGSGNALLLQLHLARCRQP